MKKQVDALVERQGAYQRVLTGVSGAASESDRFAVLTDLVCQFNYFFSLPDGASDNELREANAARKVVAHIVQQSHQSGSDTLSRLFEEAVARRLAEQQPVRKSNHDDA